MDHLSPELRKKFSQVQFLALDFDGIFTTGHVYVRQDGEESVKCDRRDGFGIELLRRAGAVKACIISREPNPVVTARAKKLQLPVWQGIERGGGKLEVLKAHVAELGIALENVAYMGDDLIDIAVLRSVGLPISVPNAHPKAQREALYVTRAGGGDGAIREVAELLLLSKGFDLEELSR